MKKYLKICFISLCVLILTACGKKEKYIIEILVPAGSTEAFVYSDEEINPIGNKVKIWAGAGLSDTEVILKPVTDKIETGYVAEYLTHGAPVEFDVDNGNDQWFKIGVSVQNPSARGPIAVSVEVEGVEVRIAEADGAPLAPTETNMDLDSVSHIELMSGLTGQKITVKDADYVQNVMDDIESLKYEKKNAVEEVGYAYRIRFYNENYDELGRIFITEENGHQISYDGYYYLVEADQNINVDYLEELLKDAPPAEPGDEGNDELTDIGQKESENDEICGYPTAEDMALEENYGITLRLEDITTTGAIIKCEQFGGGATGELQTGSWYIIEKWSEENGWEESAYVIDGEIGWTSEPWLIMKDEVVEWEVNWEWLYGELPVGKYRIGKQIMDWRAPGDYDTVLYYAEFELRD